MICKSHAKINLSLRVTGKREDGYHFLEMVNLPLALHDVIEFSSLPYYQDTYITCDDLGLANLKDNLCKKAFLLMKEKYDFKQNFLIHVHKEIPFAAGMGGGSSNAACVLLALNKLLHLGATIEDLSEIGTKIGADVPFFLRTTPHKVSGIGEILEPIKVKKDYHCLIVKPEQGLSTKKVYSLYDADASHAEIDTDGVIRGLATGDDAMIARSLGNDLMAPAMKMCPEVETIFNKMQEKGFPISRMTGSGSACFALSENGHALKEAARYFDKAGYLTVLTKVLR